MCRALTGGDSDFGMLSLAKFNGHAQWWNKFLLVLLFGCWLLFLYLKFRMCASVGSVDSAKFADTFAQENVHPRSQSSPMALRFSCHRSFVRASLLFYTISFSSYVSSEGVCSHANRQLARAKTAKPKEMHKICFRPKSRRNKMFRCPTRARTSVVCAECCVYVFGSNETE